MANSIIRKIAIWTSSTLGVAILGGAVTLVYTSARPTVEVVAVRQSLSANERFVTDKTEVTVPSDFRKMIEKTLWTTILPFRRQSTKYESLIEGLNDNEERMKRLDREVYRFAEDYKRLKAILEKGGHANSEDKNEFYDLWERNDGFIYASILGEFHLGNLLLPDSTYTGKPFFLLSVEEGYIGENIEIWTVSRRGARFNTAIIPSRSSDFFFQKQVSHALAHFDTQILSILLRFAKADTKDAAIADEILEEIDKVRMRFSRWAVTLAISNAGSRSLALLPFAELIVETKGLRSGETAVNTSTTIRLELRGEDGEPAAIQLQGGNAALVTFVSTDFIGDHEESEILSSAYNLGARDCRVRVFTTGGGFLTRPTIVTKKKEFAPAQSGRSSQ